MHSHTQNGAQNEAGDRHSEAAPARPRTAGLRRASPESLAARRLARKYREDDAPRRVTRAMALRTVKRAAPALGVGAARLALIDRLFACSKPADWTTPGGSPVVWPSNDFLARAMGVSVSAMRYHLNRLAHAGLIAFCDGPTGRRHGRRDENGAIVDACGIDLSPIAMRLDELNRIAEANEEEARHKKRLRYHRTVLVKDIRSLIASAMERRIEGPAEGFWHHALARLDMLREQRPAGLDALEVQVACLQGLFDELDAAYGEGSICLKPDTAVGNFTYHTITTELSNSGICNQSGIAHSGDSSSLQAAYGSGACEKPRADCGQDKQFPVETAGTEAEIVGQPGVAPGIGACADAAGAMQPPGEYAGPSTGAAANGSFGRGAFAAGAMRVAPAGQTRHLSIDLMRAACPAVIVAGPGVLADWNALRGCGRALCGAAGINPQVFEEAAAALGPDIAVAAAAVTVQKAAMGRVENPGAYLRTLTKRGRAGELDILRSLHGLANALAGARQAEPAENGENPMDEAQTGDPGGDAADPEPDGGDNRARPSPAGDGHSVPPETPGTAPGRKAAARPGVPVPADAFPATGSIAHTPFAPIVRTDAPEPVPDVDRVAGAFRAFARRKDIDLTSPNVATVFAAFCRKWRK